MSKKGKDKSGSDYSSKWLEILDSVTNIIIIPILVLSVICSIVMINAKRNNSVPNLFGYSLVTVLSESMTNSGFEVNDTVLVKSINADDIEVGDIIAYYRYIETNKDIKAAALQAQASEEQRKQTEITEASYLDDGSDYPTYSKVSSWKLFLNKIFSNLTYTASEASERAIRANSTIVFHQVVEKLEYQNNTWFKTWGTSSIDELGNPKVDGYWIKSDYVIGVYTNTSSVIRGFLGFASTNTGIIWMVEVPSGVQLILSTLELIEIIDMMSRLKHDQIKTGTYMDKDEYKKILRQHRKLVATGNVDIDAYRRFGPTYENYAVKYSDRNKLKNSISINGPPDSLDISDTGGMSYGNKGAPYSGEPPWNNKDGPPNGKDGPPWNNKDGPPWNNKDGPPNGKDGPPYSNRDGTQSGRDGPPNEKDGPPYSNRDGTQSGRDGPPNDKDGPPNVHGSPPARSQIEKQLLAGRPKWVVNEKESEDEIRNLEKLKSVLLKISAKYSKRFDIKLGINEIILTEREVSSLEDMYAWIDFCFVSKARISKKGFIVEPSSYNEIFIIDNKTKKQYATTALGTIYSVQCGLIVSEKGLYKVIFRPEGVIYERIDINPEYKVVSAKQDIFGNIRIGVVNGPQEEEVSYTSDGKRVSISVSNALLALGDDKRLYFVTMDNSFDLSKGKITDLKVISRDGSLVAVKPKLFSKVIFFEDGYSKYGYSWYNGTYLCLDNGYKYFNIATKETYTLPENIWQLSDEELAVKSNDGNLYKIRVPDYLDAMARGSTVDSIQNKLLLFENVMNVSIKGDNLEFTATNSDKRFVTPLSEKFLARAKIRLSST